jgi:hypothetical protein
VPTKVGMKLTGTRPWRCSCTTSTPRTSRCARRPSWWRAGARRSRGRGRPAAGGTA